MRNNGPHRSINSSVIWHLPPWALALATVIVLGQGQSGLCAPAKISQKFFDRGLQMMAKCKFKDAISFFTVAISSDPGFAMAYDRRGACLMQIEDFNAAQKDIDKAITIDPTLALAYADRATIYNENGQHKEAIDAFSKAITLSKSKPEPSFYANRSALYRESGQLDKAMADLNEALRLRPTAYWTYYFRACIYFQQARYKEALADISNAIKFAGTDKQSSFYLLRARCYEKLGNRTMAKKDRESAHADASDWVDQK